MVAEKLINWEPLARAYESLSTNWRFVAVISTIAIIIEILYFICSGIPWAKMGVAEWAYWVGAIGSIGAILMAFRLATSETRRRRDEDMSKARLAAIHIHTELLSMESTAYGVQENLKEIQEIYAKELKFPGQNIENFVDFGQRLENIKPFSSSDLLLLVPLGGNCAYKIALGQGLISACSRILSGTIITPMTGTELQAYIINNLNVLDKALNAIKQARAVVMEQATPVMLASDD